MLAEVTSSISPMAALSALVLLVGDVVVEQIGPMAHLVEIGQRLADRTPRRGVSRRL
jgi:hypothetical protein